MRPKFHHGSLSSISMSPIREQSAGLPGLWAFCKMESKRCLGFGIQGGVSFYMKAALGKSLFSRWWALCLAPVPVSIKAALGNSLFSRWVYSWLCAYGVGVP